MQAVRTVRASWNSASFLLYAGGITIALSILGLLAEVSGESSSGGLVGWVALVLAVLLALASGARASGRWLTAGLFAVSAVIALAIFVGALEDWFGWLDHDDSLFGGFHLSHLLIELVLIVGAMAARRLFRFPLLVLVSAGAGWFFVTDLLSNGGNWSAVVTLLYGIGAMFVGVASDRVFGFWTHVVAGLTIGGALIYFWHSGSTEWLLIALASLVYLALASGLARSSYAVLGAIGLLLTTTHFVEKWFDEVPFPLDYVFYFFGGFSDESNPSHPWAAALSYAVYGLVLMALGLWLARRRGVLEPA